MSYSKTYTLDVHGQPLRTRTQRRYVVVVYRPEPLAAEGNGYYVRFARVEKRSDSLETARREQRKADIGPGCKTAIYDLDTLCEVA